MESRKSELQRQAEGFKAELLRLAENYREEVRILGELIELKKAYIIDIQKEIFSLEVKIHYLQKEIDSCLNFTLREMFRL